jgi:dihydrodipicolinate reductase
LQESYSSKMKISIAGSGKLANAILSSGLEFPAAELVKWEELTESTEKAVIVHAGSGRQLQECIDYCERTGSIFIELSTGLETEKLEPNFTLVICPNTSLLLLKTLHLAEKLGNLLSGEKISILESHQASKKSVPGTAYNFARSLKIPVDRIESVREKERQLNEIGIPQEFLDSHAFHKITVQDGLDEVTIETKVLGHASYAKGVKKIIDAVLHHQLEKKRYTVIDLIDEGLI